MSRVFFVKIYSYARTSLSVRYFMIVVRADTYARINKVSRKLAIYVVFIALCEELNT